MARDLPCPLSGIRTELGRGLFEREKGALRARRALRGEGGGRGFARGVVVPSLAPPAFSKWAKSRTI